VRREIEEGVFTHRLTLLASLACSTGRHVKRFVRKSTEIGLFLTFSSTLQEGFTTYFNESIICFAFFFWTSGSSF
jgi:hypothetical protein